MRNTLALIIVLGYFSTIIVIWLSYLGGLTFEKSALDAVKAVSEYGAGLVGVVLGYYFSKAEGPGGG